MNRKKLLKLAFLYLWICLERLCFVGAMVFTVTSCITYLVEFDPIIFAVQLCTAMLTVTSWKAADHDEVKLEKAMNTFKSVTEDSYDEYESTLSEGGFRNEQAF